MSVAGQLHARYRAHGADPPFTDLRRAHGTAMDGWFWRFSDPDTRRVVIALCGISRDRDGGYWSNVAIRAHPGGLLAEAILPCATPDARAFALQAGQGAVTAGPDRLAIDLGTAALHVRLSYRDEWVAPALGGVGTAHLIPGLGQYWHPYLFGAQVDGAVEIDGETIDLSGFRVYAERNWGAGGFPPRWWWGQAQGFEDPSLCVAFAGGDVVMGPHTQEATAVIIRRHGRVIRLGNPVLAPVRAHVDAGWSLRARGPVWSVELDGQASPGDALALPVPLPAERRTVAVAHQHLTGRLHLVLRRRGRVVYAGASEIAGLERGDLAQA